MCSYLYVSGLGGQARLLPGRHHCGGVGGEPCRPEPTSSWSPRLAVASPGNEQGLGRYGNEPETPPPAAASNLARPEPGPEGGPESCEEMKCINIITIMIIIIITAVIIVTEKSNITDNLTCECQRPRASLIGRLRPRSSSSLLPWLLCGERARGSRPWSEGERGILTSPPS